MQTKLQSEPFCGARTPSRRIKIALWHPLVFLLGLNRKNNLNPECWIENPSKNTRENNPLELVLTFHNKQIYIKKNPLKTSAHISKSLIRLTLFVDKSNILPQNTLLTITRSFFFSAGLSTAVFDVIGRLAKSSLNKNCIHHRKTGKISFQQLGTGI